MNPNNHQHRNGTFKWEDYDTLDEFDDSEEETDSQFLRDLKLGQKLVSNTVTSNSLKRLANLAPIRQSAAVSATQEMPIKSLLKMQSAQSSTPRSGGSGGSNHSEDIKMQKGRFRIESEMDFVEQKQIDEDGKWLYEEPNGDEHGLDYIEGNMYDGDGYIDGMNRKEFRLEMKKRRIIRRTKNKEYKDRVMEYQRAEFLYNQVQPHLFDESTKKKRSKHKLSEVEVVFIPLNVLKKFFATHFTKCYLVSSHL